MQLEEGEYLQHYGILRKSGRYPWGSGANPSQRSKTFLQIIDEHKKAGLTESQIAALYDDEEKGFPFTVSDLRAVKSRSVNMQKREQIRKAQSLKDKGMGNSEIARTMGINESSVRSLLEPGRLQKLDELEKVAEMLKRQVAEKKFLDVGAQVERDLPIHSEIPNIGISKDKFNTAISLLKEEGYQVHPVYIPQVGTGEITRYKVLVPPGVSKTDAYANRDKIRPISEKTTDGGKTFNDLAFVKPLNVDPKRVGIRYKEEGGADADGVIYVRPGKEDLSLGKSHYAQVRIAVGGTHFLKGMAIYKNDLPPGVDLVFNTNKSDTGNKLDAMKPLKKLPLKDKDGNIVRDKNGKAIDSDEPDWSNPFGSFPKPGGQIKDAHGNAKSAMNILNEEGDWSGWSRNLSRQVLSKQAPELAESQLKLTYARRRQEFEEIRALTNPEIKAKLLESFADDTESSSVHLKAANMPRQATKVLMPVGGMKKDEIFAPEFENGERVALIRFPHAGRFEIPQLTVNNRNREARELFNIGKGGAAPDAVGIHPKVAERLSGADFDGDTVLVIPNKRGEIKSDPALDQLKDFDPQQYKVPTPEQDPVNGYKTISDSRKQTEMGMVTNLIADMTLLGASRDELARAVKHSMVVIDSEKHNLDFKASERENGILALKKHYQGVHEKGQLKGAATLITRATSREDVPKRKQAKSSDVVKRGIDTRTGKKVWEYTGEVDARGKEKTFRSKKLAETEDAFTLLSDHGGTRIERVYAEHSNKMKALANEARKEMVNTKPSKYQPSAKKVYHKEVASLNAKLNEALKNAPLERQAQVVANQIVAQRRRANPDMEKSERKKIKGKALEEARLRTGAGKTRIDITDDEWRAITSGAISSDKLKKILNNTDIDKLRARATPRDKPVMTDTMTALARNMLASGHTLAEVSDRLGIPPSTIQSTFSEGG